jgi:hypothetical protein
VGLFATSLALAQTTQPPAQTPATPPGSGTPATPAPAPAAPEAEKAKEIEGKIKSIAPVAKDATMRMVTLEDGTKLALPKDLKPKKGTLKQGATVKATYQEKDGQKVVTMIEVKS